MNTNPTPGAPAVNAVLGRLHRLAEENDASAMGPVREAAMTRGATSEADVADLLANAFLSIDATNGRFLHLLARARRPGRIVEFGCSMGLSTIYLASALDEGEPSMVSTELEPAKVAAARSHVAEAGLASRVTILEGDALTTLAGIDEPVSFVFLDGWKSLYLPVLRMLEPSLVEGALVIADDTTQPMLRHLSADYLAYVRDPSNGYVSAELPIDDGIEISRRERP